MGGNTERPSLGRVLPWLVWPTAALVLLTFSLVLSVLIWTGQRADADADAQRKAQLTAAITQMLDGMRLRLAEAMSEGPTLQALLDDPVIHAVERPLGFLEFTGLFVFPLLPGDDADLPAAIHQREPLLGPVLERLKANLRGLEAGALDTAEARAQAGVARLIFDGGVYGVIAVPLPRERAGVRMIAVACKDFSEADLASLAALHSIHGLRLSEAEVAGQMNLPVRDSLGRVVAHMTWLPSHPGEALRRDLLPLLVFGGFITLGLLGLLGFYVRWVGDVVARHEAQNKQLIGHDPLSGLANRRLFGERLEHELHRLRRGGEPFAVLFLDLDRFKLVNDTLGHAAGDALLRQVAARLTDLTRAEDTLARFGGDEFAIVQTRVQPGTPPDGLARRVVEALAHPFDLAGTRVLIGVSVGIALAPTDGTDRDELMRRADIALYEAKGQGRNRACVFSPALEEEVLTRGLVEAELRRAIEDGGLHLVYQPIVSRDGAAVVAVEALVRWDHSTRGPIGPDAFIPIAEERGLIGTLGEWVLRRACADALRWPGVTISVNVSPLQFRQADFVGRVMSVLEETGLDPRRLELELTENAVIGDEAGARAVMSALGALGIRFALDDFGRGYSSLIYLRRFAFQTIKIDRSFLEGIETDSGASLFVGHMIGLGHALGLTVTAEGVETAGQHELLQALGCDRLQGFLFARPRRTIDVDRLMFPASSDRSAA